MSEPIAKKLAEWLHLKLAAAQNLPYEDGDTCPDCVEAIEQELLPLLGWPPTWSERLCNLCGEPFSIHVRVLKGGCVTASTFT